MPIDPNLAAATLAIDLINENLYLDDLAGADIAWTAYKEVADPMFQSDNYCDEVLGAIKDIRLGSRGRIEPPLGILVKAREMLNKSRSTQY